MFTDDELEGALLKFLQTEVSTLRTERGSRDVLQSKAQVYELITSVFLMRPRAIFSVCWLASNALRALVAQQLEDLQVIVEAAPRAGESSARVESTTDLYNAEAALLSLTAAFSAREGGVRGSIGPSVQRFSASVDRFMRSELTKNTIDQGKVVKTGEELRVVISQAWTRAFARHEEIALGLSRLKDALSEFERVRLPDVAVGGIMTRVQARLAEITQVMESTEAGAQSREALLDLSAMRVLLKQASQFRTPSLLKAPLTGDVASGALTRGSGTTASITGTVKGPYYYAAGVLLSYRVGGELEQAYLPGTSAAVLRSSFRATWKRPGPGLVCALRLSGGTVEQVITTDAWTSGPAAVELINQRLKGVQSTWVGYKGELSLFTTQATKGASLTLLVETDEQAAFAAWFGSPLTAQGTGVPASEVAIALPQLLTTARVKEGAVELAALEYGPDLTIEPGEAATILGFPAVTVPGAVGTFEAPVNFAERGVEPGDELVFDGDVARYAITAVSGQSLSFTPHRAAAASVRYDVRDGAVAAYQALSQQLGALELQAGWDVSIADQAVGRLVRGARYGGTLVSALTDYQAAFYELLTLCDGYIVPREPAVEEVVRTLVEHGFDRARDLFVSLQLVAFFALDAEGVSYRTHVMRVAADTVRVAAPVAKDTGDATTRWRTTAVYPTPYDPSQRR